MMRRAYPQSLRRAVNTAGGDPPGHLPADLLGIIRKHWAARELDPYLVAALIGQESTFDAKVRVGGERLGPDADCPRDRTAARANAELRRLYAPNQLTDAEINIRLGTLYFSQLASSLVAPTTRSRAITPARAASSAGRPKGPDWTRTSSSTTFHFPNPELRQTDSRNRRRLPSALRGR